MLFSDILFANARGIYDKKLAELGEHSNKKINQSIELSN